MKNLPQRVSLVAQTVAILRDGHAVATAALLARRIVLDPQANLEVPAAVMARKLVITPLGVERIATPNPLLTRGSALTEA